MFQKEKMNWERIKEFKTRFSDIYEREILSTFAWLAQGEKVCFLEAKEFQVNLLGADFYFIKHTDHLPMIFELAKFWESEIEIITNFEFFSEHQAVVLLFFLNPVKASEIIKNRLEVFQVYGVSSLEDLRSTLAFRVENFINRKVFGLLNGLSIEDVEAFFSDDVKLPYSCVVEKGYSNCVHRFGSMVKNPEWFQKAIKFKKEFKKL